MDEELDSSLMYIMDEEGNPIPTEDADEWIRFRVESSRIRQTYPSFVSPNGLVSTVFLGQATFLGNIFETRVFSVPGYENMCFTCRTKVEALSNHERVLSILQNDPNLM